MIIALAILAIANAIALVLAVYAYAAYRRKDELSALVDQARR